MYCEIISICQFLKGSLGCNFVLEPFMPNFLFILIIIVNF